jgi:serine/threonine protein kinase
VNSRSSNYINAGADTAAEWRDSQTVPAGDTASRPSRVPAKGSPVDHQSKWSPGTIILDGYYIQSVLGRGGMGVVYLAELKLRQKTLQFAVKTLSESSCRNDVVRRLFMSELRTWIDLPAHPNIIKCHFFRTIDDNLAIFSEYASGGSLADYIRRKPSMEMREILDIAIQSAAGLLTAHRHGVVHQDVKPANILLTPEGHVKITDFGLAGVFTPKKTGPSNDLAAQESTGELTLPRGMTLAYCSYEQAAGEKIDYRTDIWSWGLTVLELLCGSAFWGIGSIAPELLQKALGTSPDYPHPRMPDRLIGILDRCFQKSRRDRWESFEQIIQKLCIVFHEETGMDYAGVHPEIAGSFHAGRADTACSKTIAKTWTEPDEWVQRFNRIPALEPVRMRASVRERPVTIRAAALIDLEYYEAIQLTLEKSLKALEREPKSMQLFVAFLLERAKLHRVLADYPGSQGCLTRAIAVCEAAGPAGLPVKTFELLAESMSMRFQNYKDMNEYEAALKEVDALIKLITHRLLASPAIPGLLGRASRAKASLVFRTVGPANVAGIFDQAQALLEKLVSSKPYPMYEIELAKLYATKATFLYSTGRAEESIQYFDMAAAIWEPMLDTAADDTVVDLTNVYRNKAIALRIMMWFDEANRLFERVTSMFKELVMERGRHDLMHELAGSYMNQANGQSDLRNYEEAARLFDQAIELTEKLFFEEGRMELVYHLALEYNNKAVIISDAGRPGDSIPLYERSLELYESLVFERGLIEHRLNLAHAHSNLAVSYGRCGRWELFELHFDRFVSIITGLIDANDRKDLLASLAEMLIQKLTLYHENGFKEDTRALKKRILRIIDTEMPPDVKTQFEKYHPDSLRTLRNIPS